MNASLDGFNCKMELVTQWFSRLNIDSYKLFNLKNREND